MIREFQLSTTPLIPETEFERMKRTEKSWTMTKEELAAYNDKNGWPEMALKNKNKGNRDVMHRLRQKGVKPVS